MDLHIPVDFASQMSAIALCMHALILVVASSTAQHDPDTIQKDNYVGNTNQLHDDDFWKYKDSLLSPEEVGELSKRLSASSFSFSRGKKDLSYPDELGEMISAPIRRLSASEFFGARGRRAPPDGFFGSRGKRLFDDEVGDDDMEMSKRQPPKGFVVVRGKRLSSSGFIGMRGKKDSSPPMGFLGMRGKKYALSPFGFQGARGKRPSDTADMYNKRPSLPQGFFGSRGRRAGQLEQLTPDYNSPKTHIDKIGNSLINRWQYLIKPTNHLADLFSKRQPSAGFYPLRG